MMERRVRPRRSLFSVALLVCPNSPEALGTRPRHGRWLESWILLDSFNTFLPVVDRALSWPYSDGTRGPAWRCLRMPCLPSVQPPGTRSQEELLIKSFLLFYVDSKAFDEVLHYLTSESM